MSEEQIKACPFCGGEAKYQQLETCGWRIICTNTDCLIHTQWIHSEKKYALHEWNRRAGDRAPDANKTTDAQHVEHQRIVRRLALAVMKEAVQKGWADIWDPSWNHKAHVELTLTIAEVRLAASLVGYHPTKAEISRGDELEKWDALIAEQDKAEKAS